MWQGRSMRVLACLAIVATVASSTARAQNADELAALNRQVAQLQREGQYAKAGALAEQVLAARERLLGLEHPSTLASVNNLAHVYQAQGRYSEAELLFRRALVASERVLGKEHLDTLIGVNNLAVIYQAQGRYGEAEPLSQRALAAYERVLGKEHPDTLTCLNNLAFLYQARGRYGEAEPLYRRALGASERVLGKEHPDTLGSVNNLAHLYQAQGRYGEAEPLYRRALAAYARMLGKDHPDTLGSVNNLAVLYQEQGRYRKAEPLYRRALESYERVLGKEHPSTLTSVNNLAFLYQAEGRYDEAEPLYRRALAARERGLSWDHPDTLTSVNNLAFLCEAQGRYGEAESLYSRAVAGRERTLGVDHPDTLGSINNLGMLYQAQGRYRDAEPLFSRALAARERVLGKEHPDTLGSINTLAALYRRQQRYGEAEPLHRHALAAYERVLGKEHPNTLGSVSELAAQLYARGSYAEAEPLFRRALGAYERVLGPEHPSTLNSVNNLALLYKDQGRYDEAEPLYRRALAARERALGPEHPDTLMTVSNLALLYEAQGEWTRTAQLWRRSTAGIASRTQRGAVDAGQGVTGMKKSETERLSWQFWGLVKAVHRLVPADSGPDAAVSREMFQTAQWALSSEAAQSLIQMAARGAKGNVALSAMVRERQDLVADWQKRDARRNAMLGQEEPVKRDAEAEAANTARLAAIDARIAAIDKQLGTEFEGYAALASPTPLSVEEAQAQLGGDEALVLFLDTPKAGRTPEETFIWVVTKTEMRWVRSDLGKEALTREVQALRCGLDSTAWRGQSRCPELTGQNYSPEDEHAGKPPPFDIARAFGLYKVLFGGIEDLIKGKHLLLVPSGALTQLPFAVLVTATPASGDHKAAAWLARDHAVTVLPAVSSLRALRATSRPSAATKPLVGFGNPLLDGGNSQSNEAKLARAKESCSKMPWQRVTALFGLRDGLTPMETRGGLANVSLIRRQAPLPETADEVCAVASDTGADVSAIRLGARATEHEVKAMSERDELAQYRVVHFATHGATAGELKGSSEPGLILTPPDTASEDDDGYLSATEIAGLKLDADWVILSACNTAAGNAENAEALSGLARAFIYAQARALLVSHWAVNSKATVTLITSAMREIARDRTVGRAEALRRAMLALIDKGEPYEAHPAYWAPFIVVGEGGTTATSGKAAAQESKR